MIVLLCLCMIIFSNKLYAFTTLRRNLVYCAASTFLKKYGGSLGSKDSHKQKVSLPQISKALFASLSTSTMAKPKSPVEIFRSDYKSSDFSVSEAFLSFKLDHEKTRVVSNFKITSAGFLSDLTLNGENLNLISVRINNIVLEKTMYEVNEETLTIYKSSLPEQSFTLETEVELNPSQNLALSGLYSSGSMLCTQCEAMGFRRITYHLDRPDILTRYTVRLEANKSRFPILLSNGNKLESGVSEDNPENHYVIWNDPFPKPSYLFALVAGDLGSIHDTYETKEGLEVALGIYSEAKNVNKLQHAMYSLKESMKWDERTFGK